MSKKIKDMTLSEIINQIGMPLRKRTYLNILRDFRKTQNKVIELLNKPDGIKQLIQDESILDKSKFVFAIALDLEKQITESMISRNGEKVKDETKKKLEIAKKMLKDEDVTISDGIAIKGRISVVTKSSLDFLGKSKERDKKKQKTIDRLNKIKTENPETYEEMIRNICTMDFMDFIINNREIGFRLISKIYGNVLIDQEKITIQDILNGTSKYLNLAKEMKPHEATKEIEKSLYDFAEYLNVDKLILITILRKYSNAKTTTRDIETMNEIKQYINILSQYIEDRRVSIYGETEDILGDKILISKESPITLKTVNESMKNYVNGIDYGKGAVVDEVIKGLMNGSLNLDEFSDEEINIILMQHKKREFIERDERFTIRFIQMGILSKKEIEEIKQGIISEEVLINLYKSEQLSKEEILAKYLNNEIKLQGIRKLRDELEDEKELNDLVQPDCLVKTFFQRDSDNEKYQKLKNLFYELRIRNKTLEERNEVGNSIIEQDDNMLEKQNLINLYTDRLITIDNAIDWGGENIAIELLKSSKLVYEDARRLYDNEILKIENFENIIRNPSIKLVKKLSFVNGVFSRSEDEEIRKKLLKKIQLEKAEKNKNKNKGKRNNKQKKDPKDNNSKEDNRRITDPAARWGLYRTIDPDYTEDVTRDGYLIKEMPSVNTVAIEPLYRSDDDITNYAIDAATFFVDRDKYLENRSNIITERNKVNVGFLNEIYSKGDCFKITHTTKGKTWARKVQRYFLDIVGIQRTPEELDAIDEAAKAVDESCRSIVDLEI